LQQTFDMQGKLDAAVADLEAERGRFEQEGASIRDILEQTRQRLNAETARWGQEQQQWERKEQQYLIDIGELQALSARVQQESGQSSEQIHRLSDTLKQAKNAIEKTLAEMLRERQLRAEADRERADAVKKVEAVQRHFDELSKAWNEERAQWRE